MQWCLDGWYVTKKWAQEMANGMKANKWEGDSPVVTYLVEHPTHHTWAVLYYGVPYVDWHAQFEQDAHFTTSKTAESLLEAD